MKKKIDFSFIQEYLIFNKREQRGLWVLSLLIFLVIVINGLLPMLYQDKQVDFSAFEEEVKAFEASLAKTKTKNRRPASLMDSTVAKEVDEKEFVKEEKPVIVKQVQKKEVLSIELNACDSIDLIKLKGIGPVFASRIIKYRRILGGYYCKEQLIDVYGMDSERLNPILSSITVDTNLLIKMDLNTIEFKQLLKHPYFEYEIVKAIFNYKRDINEYSEVSQLLSVSGISEEMYLRMRKYLIVNSNP